MEAMCFRSWTRSQRKVNISCNAWQPSGPQSDALVRPRRPLRCRLAAGALEEVVALEEVEEAGALEEAAVDPACPRSRASAPHQPPRGRSSLSSAATSFLHRQ